MSRSTLLAVAILLVASVATVAAAGGVGGGQPAAAPSNATTLPGAQYAGAVGAQAAEVDAEHRDLTLAVRLDNATTNASRARVVAAELDDVRSTVADLEARADALDATLEGETADDGEATSQGTVLVARAVALERHLTDLEAVAASLPDAVRERHDVTTARFDDLKSRLDSLTDEQLVSLATAVAGEDVGDDLDESEDEADEADEDDEIDGDETATNDGTDGDDTETDSDGDSDAEETAGQTETADEDDAGDESSDGETDADAGDSGTDSTSAGDSDVEGSDSDDGGD